MLILLTQETAEVSPVFLIFFVAAVIGLTFLSMIKTSDKSVEAIKRRYEGKILAECMLGTKLRTYCFVTEDEFVMQRNQNCFVAYPLENIAYARSFRDIATRDWTFAVWDKDQKQKGLDGKMVAGTQKIRKYRGTSLLVMKKDQADQLCEFLAEHAPHVQIL